MVIIKRGIKAHLKGSQYERKFSKQLSLWWTLGISSDVFWRTPNSGGKATTLDSDVHVGDICATKEISKPLENSLVFELKRGYTKTLLLDWLIYGSKSQIGQWWTKGQSQATALNRKFLLVIKPDHYPEMGFMYFDELPFLPKHYFVNSEGIACFKLEEVLWQNDPVVVAEKLLNQKELQKYKQELRKFRSSTLTHSTSKKSTKQKNHKKDAKEKRPKNGGTEKQKE